MGPKDQNPNDCTSQDGQVYVGNDTIIIYDDDEQIVIVKEE